jgi:toxin ParE1/3/4
MDFKVIFGDIFLADLEEIIRFIAAENPTAARRLGEMIVRTGESLGYLPERYPRVRQRPQIRRFIVRKHFKIFYRIDRRSRTVEILRCWDARRGQDPSLAQR